MINSIPKYRIGDRLESLASGNIYDVVNIELDPSNYVIYSCTQTTREGSTSTADMYFYTESNWKYLGNFAKANNFNSLYDKLSS